MKHLMTSKSRKLLPLLDLIEQRKEQEVTGNQKVPAVGESYVTGAMAFSRSSRTPKTCDTACVSDTADRQSSLSSHLPISCRCLPLAKANKMSEDIKARILGIKNSNL